MQFDHSDLFRIDIQILDMDYYGVHALIFRSFVMLINNHTSAT